MKTPQAFVRRRVLRGIARRKVQPAEDALWADPLPRRGLEWLWEWLWRWIEPEFGRIDRWRLDPGEQVRWRTVDALSTLTARCRADLVDWGMDPETYPLEEADPEARRCIEDAYKCGFCWCGKYVHEHGCIRRRF